MATTLETGYRGPTACKAAGITYRQLDYWARTGLVTPSVQDAGGSGTQRLYGFSDIVRLKLIKKLLDAGISLNKIRKALDFISNDLRRGVTDVTLVSDGKTIYACTSPTEIIDLLAGGQGVFAIAVGKVYEELQGKIAEFRKPGVDGEPGREDSEAHGG
jgi:DNA-binding transcriptional MerR regulator